MKRYVKNPELSKVFLPGAGEVTTGQILEGAEYDQYVPKFLVEVPESVATPPLESTEPVSTPHLLTEPAPAPVPVVESPSVPPPENTSADDDRLDETVSSDEKRPRGRPRKTS